MRIAGEIIFRFKVNDEDEGEVISVRGKVTLIEEFRVAADEGK